MSVFTPLTTEQLTLWLKRYSLGSLEHFEGIAEGVQNSNFFLDTSHGRYVLTIFEKLTRSELPFFVNLLRAAALRFWLSRLPDFHRPRSGDPVVRRDPDEYRNILRARIAAGSRLPWLASPGQAG